MTAPAQPPPPIDYTPPPPWHARGDIRRRALLAACILGAAAALWFAGPVARHGSLLLAERACRTPKLDPPHQPVLMLHSAEATAADVSRELRGIAEYLWLLTGEPDVPPPVATRQQGHVFAGVLRSPGGNRRVVVLIARRPPSSDAAYGLAPGAIAVESWVISPWSPMRSPRVLQRSFWSADERSVRRSAAPPGRVAVYAGQIDPADDSHVSFRVEFDGQSFECDAWLRDDDRIIIQRRSTSIETHRLGAIE